MPGQCLEPRPPGGGMRAPGPGRAPFCDPVGGAGALPAPEPEGDGALELVLECELDVVAAFANAAPPPTSAPVTASVVSRGLIRWLKVIHLLWLAWIATIASERRKTVGAR